MQHPRSTLFPLHDALPISDYSRQWMKEKGEEWFKQHKKLIINQWNEIGLLMDPSHLAYTLDPAFNKLVVHARSEEHTSELQSHHDLVCRLLLEKKKLNKKQ